VDDVPWYFHNVYAPVEDALRRPFFASLTTDFEPESRHFIGGDFNLPMHPSLDSLHSPPSPIVGLDECTEWLSSLRVIDPWRMEHPMAKSLSGPGGRHRLDYIFMDSEAFISLHTSSTYSKNYFHGDHMTATTTILNTPPSATSTRHRSWKLPRELLQLPEVSKAIISEAQRLLDDLVASPTANVGAAWSAWLNRMRRKLRRCHHNRQRACLASLDRLKTQYHIARSHQAQGLVDDATVAAAASAYSTARDEWRQESLDRGFDHHANQSEQPTASFLRKPPVYKVPITTAKLGDGYTSDQAEVSRIFTAHWSRIMRSEPHDSTPTDPVRDQVLNSISKRLSDDECQILEAPLTADELARSIKSMNGNKSPGPDGWPAAFFQVAPDIFAQILLLVFNYQLDKHGIMLPHQRRSAVALLYKAGDRADPGNFRPIALMAVEVKVLSRVLAYRLSRVVAKIVDISQAGFIKDRYMTDHILTIQCLQHLATRTGSSWFATFLDFSKAYDKVRQAFLFEVMSRINIGPSFLRWVHLLYKRPNVHLSINGSLGPAIRPNQGVKQGCPLSCLLFDLYLEPLGDMLRAEPQHGIYTSPTAAPMTSMFFADDSTLLSHSLDSRDAQLAIVDKFCTASGASLNVAKCVTLPLDSNMEVLLEDGAPGIKLARAGQSIKFLGAHLGIDLPATHHSKTISDKFLESFTLWSCRARTLRGRNVLASSMVLSKLWHVSYVSLVPPDLLATWQRTLNKFVLGQRDLSSSHYRPLLNSMWLHDRGLGLSVPHLESVIRSQRLRLLQRLLRHSETQPPWVQLVRDQFSRCLGPLSRPSAPFDFLWTKPHALSHWNSLDEVHPLWQEVWDVWHSVPLDKRMAVAPSFKMDLHAPVWRTTNPMFHAESSGDIASLVDHQPITGRWIRHAASRGIHSLADIVKLGVGGFWPCFDDFHSHMSSYNPETRVVFHHGNIQLELFPRSRAVYQHLSRVYDELRRAHGVRLDLPQVFDPTPALSNSFRMVISSQVKSFEWWPRRRIKWIAFTGPAPDRPHPTSSRDRPGYAAAKTYMRLVSSSLKLLAPIHGDVWLRIILNMLPVNSRFPFRQQYDPDSMLCVHRCGDIDTMEHALHSCTHITHLWSDHADAWSPTGVSFSWFSLTNLDKFTVNSPVSQYSDTLFQLWVMLTGVSIHVIWTHHNMLQYQQRAMPPRTVLLELTFVTWMATVRRNMRLMDTDDVRRIEMEFVLRNLLLNQSHYRHLSHKYKKCLDLRATFDVH
jgi:hypothetical protein